MHKDNRESNNVSESGHEVLTPTDAETSDYWQYVYDPELEPWLINGIPKYRCTLYQLARELDRKIYSNSELLKSSTGEIVKPSQTQTSRGITQDIISAIVDGKLAAYRGHDPDAQMIRIIISSDTVARTVANMSAPYAIVLVDDVNTWLSTDDKYSAHRIESNFAGRHSSEQTNEKPSASDADPAGMKIKQSAEPPLDHWKLRIQRQACLVWQRVFDYGGTPSVSNTKNEIAKWCVDNDVRTDSGNVHPTAEYIRTHVLSSNHWKNRPTKRTPRPEQPEQTEQA